MLAEDVRKETRHRIWTEVRMMTPRGDLLGVATDISVNGMGIRSSRSLPPGTKIAVHPQVKEGIILFGEVIWEIPRHHEELFFNQMGMQIIAVTRLTQDGSVVVNVSEGEGCRVISYDEKTEMVNDIISVLAGT